MDFNQLDSQTQALLLKEANRRGISRRDFLRLVGSSAGAAIVAYLATACGAPPPTPAPPPPPTSVPAPAATSVPPTGVPPTAVPPTVAPTRPPATPTPVRTGKLVYAWSSPFDDLDPNATTSTRAGRLGIHVIEPLVWQPKAGQFAPGLAASWEASPDATQYTFKLRKDVKFHDGTPFDAKAVKFTFDRIVDPALKSQTALSLMGPYKSTEVIDDYTVKVTFKQPYAPFLDSCSTPYLGITSPAAVAKYGKDYGVTMIVGSGPFILKSFKPGSEAVLVPNPDYKWAPDIMKHNGPPYLESITWKVIQETGTRTGTVETGEVNFIEDVPTVDVKRLKANPDIVVLALAQGGSGESLMMNVTRPPTDQLAVRRAIQQAIDKKGMSDAVFDGVYPVACSIIQPSIFGYDPETCKMYPYDLAAAKKSLADAGWVDTNNDGIVEKGGQPLALDLYFRQLPLNQSMSQYVQNQLRKVGINVNLIGLERAGYFDAVRAGKHHLQFWWETFTDPDGVRIMVHSSNAGGGTNRNNYVNAEMDKLIADAAATSDPAKRKELYAKIQKKVLDEAVMINLCDDQSIYAYRKGIQDFAMDIGGNYPYFYDTFIAKT